MELENQNNTEIQPNQTEIESVKTSEQEPIEDKNWAALREQRKAERKAREEAERIAKQKAEEAAALKAALEAIVNKPNPQNNNDYYEESEEQVLEKKLEALLKKKEEEFLKRQQEEELKTYPTKLKQTYQDFDQVVQAENLDYLEYYHPEVAEAFKYMPEGYKKWEAIYKATKKFVPNLSKKEDAAKIQQNLKKPVSPSATGALPSQTQQNILTEERKRANWERMQRALKGLS